MISVSLWTARASRTPSGGEEVYSCPVYDYVAICCGALMERQAGGRKATCTTRLTASRTAGATMECTLTRCCSFTCARLHCLQHLPRLTRRGIEWIKLQSACWTDISIRIRASDTEASAPLVPAATVPNRSANLCQVLDGTQFATQKKTWKGIFFEIFLSLLT